jgi:hypothetical protein
MGAESVVKRIASKPCTYTLCALLSKENTPSSPLSAPPWPVFPLILGFERKPYASPFIGGVAAAANWSILCCERQHQRKKQNLKHQPKPKS